MNFTFPSFKSVEKMKQKARAFNDRPPTWAYWVGGIFVMLLIQVVRHA